MNEIFAFALTFSGYTYWGSFERCAEIANSWLERFHQSGELPDTIEELRTCLFFEQQRWRHYGESPDASARAYLSALLEKLREKVSQGTSDDRRGCTDR